MKAGESLKRRHGLWPWVWVGLASCNRTFAPCPDHMVEHEGRCVPWPLDASLAPNADAQPAGEMMDASAPPLEEAGLAEEAGPQPQPGNGGEPDGTQPEPMPDAEPGAPAPLLDGSMAEPEAGDAERSTCGEALPAWQRFHVSEQLVDTILDCAWRAAACHDATCTLDACLRAATGADGCETCIAEEVACVSAACSSACGVRGGSSRCRACACAQGCVAQLEACAGSALPVCADCDGIDCAEMSLAPELIMVIVNSVLR